MLPPGAHPRQRRLIRATQPTSLLPTAARGTTMFHAHGSARRASTHNPSPTPFVSSIPASLQDVSYSSVCAPVRAALDNVRSVLAADVIKALDDAQLTEALRTLSAAAHEHRVPPEHLLICFKEVIVSVKAWDRVPRSHAQRMQEQLVTRCIEAYYTPLD